MLLQSAQDLKSQLLATVVRPFTAALANPRAATDVPSAVSALLPSIRELAVAARPLRNAIELHRTIAIGIQKDGAEYRLAVRVQRQALMGSRLLEHIVREASGEAEVRMIGRVDKRTRRARATREIADVLGEPPWYEVEQDPVLIGCSVGHQRVTAGTVGAFVSKGGRAFVLSNNHVLANENSARAGDPIVQPAPRDGGRPSRHRIAGLTEAVPLNVMGTNFLDVALAELDAGVAFDPRLLRHIIHGEDRTLAGVGPREIQKGANVYKIGRTTGATKGQVVAFDIENVVVNYNIGNVRFDRVIEVEGAGEGVFSDGGDSGALIVDENMQAVGLLFAGTEQGGSDGLGLTYASPMVDVLEGVFATLIT